MQKTTFSMESKTLTLYGQPDPQVVFLQPVDDHDQSGLDAQAAALAQQGKKPFLLCAWKIDRWGTELSPWKAPAVFGGEEFGDGAAETLAWLTDSLIPALTARCRLPEETEFVLGGYSLAGLFALWCGYQTHRFHGIAAASPSVWFPGWLDFARSHPFLAAGASLSLGDREARTRNPVLATVADCIREQHALLQAQGVDAVLAWNPGNHFKDPELRMARAFARFL